MPTTFTRYRDDLEHKVDNEDEIVASILASMSRANEAVAAKHRHGVRDAHAKSHGILAGELRVHANAPAPYRQGLFAEPATYPVIVRLSTAPGDLRSDDLGAPRGMAIKVIGVPGERALNDDAITQDFLLVNDDHLPFGTLDKYLEFQKVLEAQPAMTDTEIRNATRKGKAIGAVLTALHRPLPVPVELATVTHNNDILGETFNSLAALRHGDYVAKISAAPLTRALRARTGKPIPKGESALQQVVADYFRHQDGEYSIRAQLCTDPAIMPIEDATVAWPEALSPHVSVATLHLPAQNTYSDARRVFADDTLSFSPWHALAAHRPLGAIMRSRARAYPSSSDFRHGYNQVAAREPRDIGELPD
ncbi:catalase family protein [Arthrobacter bambusae]|uniref:Nucleic acid-binding Zn ribbon protein n=1 Tax=Arthrobacter bambusae TaxID=1338426 RepID=A0AAW8DFB8_9MICC|nr:catalase family protein [Arthrobacter bambusae]MDP9904587.1 putative nucleic acid-binding Zn ribbon protein [Arthrobacter bambusae]MDQ0129403.1 putative nucleic acid-binding Zn ribbon protein [Arthrobacter bambusae]MDQ0180984.1 putative nucleic acid-binding Zn ribbon protein [Arthrobacter bambusae]